MCTNFVTTNFGTLDGTSLPVISLSKNQDFQVQATSSLKEPFPPKMSPLKLQRRTLDLSSEDPTTLAPCLVGKSIKWKLEATQEP